jgi:hypothetical protein
MRARRTPPPPPCRLRRLRPTPSPPCSVWVYDDAHPGCAVLMAATGRGAPLLQHCIVTRDADAAPLRLRAGDGAPLVVSVPRGRAAPPAGAPEDLMQLHQLGGLSSFVLVPVGPPAAPLGALLLAKAEPGPMTDDWWAGNGVGLGMVGGRGRAGRGSAGWCRAGSCAVWGRQHLLGARRTASGLILVR